MTSAWGSVHGDQCMGSVQGSVHGDQCRDQCMGISRTQDQQGICARGPGHGDQGVGIRRGDIGHIEVE
jgi:hypothetical protein